MQSIERIKHIKNGFKETRIFSRILFNQPFVKYEGQHIVYMCPYSIQTLASSFTQEFICKFYLILVHAQLVLAISEVKSEKKEELVGQKSESF